MVNLQVLAVSPAIALLPVIGSLRMPPTSATVSSFRLQALPLTAAAGAEPVDWAVAVGRLHAATAETTQGHSRRASGIRNMATSRNVRCQKTTGAFMVSLAVGVGEPRHIRAPFR